jgi:hypothetical protein
MDKNEIWFEPEPNRKFKNLREKQGYFNYFYPHEISWAEVRESHYEMWSQLCEIAKELVAFGRLDYRELKFMGAV